MKKIVAGVWCGHSHVNMVINILSRALPPDWRISLAQLTSVSRVSVSEDIFI